MSRILDPRQYIFSYFYQPTYFYITGVFLSAEISGDMHFDNDEEFTYKKNYGTDLLWVATHEAGHSLGLEHSAEQNAVMYPWYQGGLGDFDLRHDDIVGIQTLYGKISSCISYFFFKYSAH